MTTVADLLLAHADDDRPALLFGDEVWSYRRLVAEGSRRADLYAAVHDPDRPPHVGVLLDNGPEYLLWLVAAALSGAVVVGVNATYRGEQLALLMQHTDCELLVTASGFAPILADCPVPVPPERVWVVDGPAYGELVAAGPAARPDRAAATADDLYLLIFTSGSTGAPKAVRCTQGRMARTGAHVARIADLGPADVTYIPSPFFHSSALFTGWASALAAGIPIATRPRFSASGTVPDLVRFGATFMNYTGKVLNYVLATPERDTDRDCPLRLAVGNEASAADIERFADRFGCHVRDSYGSTEGLIIIRRESGMPAGALGSADPTVLVVDQETGKECPRAAYDAGGRVTNLREATGEIVETSPSSAFEGYYRNEAATEDRFRGGWYWSGDLAYRDEDGWFFFAGRANDWLRVDGENFAGGPVESILSRFPGLRSVAVYAVPDDPVGDRVMAAVELADPAAFDARAFEAFLAAQPDLGPKWVPSFVLPTAELPKLASMKIDRRTLRERAWRPDGVLWRPARGAPLRPLTGADRVALERLL